MRKQKVKRKAFGIGKRFLLVRKMMQENGIYITKITFGKKTHTVVQTIKFNNLRRSGKTNLQIMMRHLIWMTWEEFPKLRKLLMTKDKKSIMILGCDNG